MNVNDLPIIGQPRVEDAMIVFQVACPCGKGHFQIVGLIGASAKCPQTECPYAFQVSGPCGMIPNMQDGTMESVLPLRTFRLGPDGRPL